MFVDHEFLLATAEVQLRTGRKVEAGEATYSALASKGLAHLSQDAENCATVLGEPLPRVIKLAVVLSCLDRS